VGKPRRIAGEAQGAEFRIEYVRSRRVVRVVASHCGKKLPALELGLEEFWNELGIDAAELARERRFLLFAGSGSPAGGTRDLVAHFTSENDARRAFWRLLQRKSPPYRWAEVATLDAAGRMRQLCWFGERGGPGDTLGARCWAQPGQRVRRSAV
jgi:hypothetical protein